MSAHLRAVWILLHSALVTSTATGGLITNTPITACFTSVHGAKGNNWFIRRYTELFLLCRILNAGQPQQLIMQCNLPRDSRGGQTSTPSYGTISWMSCGLSWNLINIKSPTSVTLRELWDTGVMFVFAPPRTVSHPQVWSKASFELLFLIILWQSDYSMFPVAGFGFLLRLHPKLKWNHILKAALNVSHMIF